MEHEGKNVEYLDRFVNIIVLFLLNSTGHYDRHKYTPLHLCIFCTLHSLQICMEKSNIIFLIL